MTDISIIAIGTALLSIFLLFITIKQIGGLPGYTIYYPLLASLSWIIVSPFVDSKIIAIMLIAAIVGRFLQKRLTKKYISLLLYPRHGFYAGISTILLILGWWILSRRNIVDRHISISLVGYIALVYALILSITPKVFGQGKGISSLSRWLHNIRFSVLTALCIKILTHEVLLQRFDHYPFLFIIIFLLCIIIGKYPGLQIMEMMRFRRIIRSKKIQYTKYTSK